MTNTPFNPISGTIYQGRNIGTLMNASKCLEWATYLQWNSKGFQIKKGEHGITIWTFVESDRKNPLTGKIETGHAPRCYKVFNREQVEKLTI